MLILSMVPASAFAADAAQWTTYPEDGQSGTVVDNRSISVQMKDSASLLVENIQTDASREDIYCNKLKTKLDPSTALTFSFAMEGSGYSNHLDSIKANTYPNIGIYTGKPKDEITEENCVASLDKGNLTFTESYNTNDGKWNIDLQLKENTLEPETDYALVFKKEICGNKTDITLGKDIRLFFTTGTAGSGNTGSSGETPEESGYGPQGINNTLTLKSPSDITAESESTLAGKTWYKNKINGIMSKENGIISFGFTLRDGVNNFSPESFDRYKDDIGIYSADGKQKITGVVLDEDEFEQTGKIIKIHADATALNGSTYILRFGPSVCGNNPAKNIDCYIDFTFNLPQVEQAEPVPVKVTGVKMNVKQATLTVGKTRTLKATVAPANAANKAVTWSSSNRKVARVLKGKVTAVAPGTATITARTKDGGFRARTVIKVRPKTTTLKLTRPYTKAVKIKYKKIKNVDGYRIYRAQKKNGKYKKVVTRKQNKSGTYINKGLKKKKTYYYKVRTYKVVKGKRIYSEYSKAVKVRTK